MHPNYRFGLFIHIRVMCSLANGALDDAEKSLLGNLPCLTDRYRFLMEICLCQAFLFVMRITSKGIFFIEAGRANAEVVISYCS